MDMVPGPADRLALMEGARRLVEAMEMRHLSEIFAATPDALVSDLLRPPGEEPEPAGDVLSRLTTASQYGWDKAQGGDLAYIPSGGPVHRGGRGMAGLSYTCVHGRGVRGARFGRHGGERSAVGRSHPGDAG
jgi:hypothetical protein